jgi:glycosyltransferase involved in cell wall biosynthesis
MPRLVIFCEFLTLLGGERSMLSTLPSVVRAGFDVHVAAPPQGELADAVRAIGIPVIEWMTHDADGERRSLDDIRVSAAQLIEQLRPDLVHANSLSTARLIGPVAAATGVSSLGHIRDIVGLSRQAIDDVNANGRLVAVSQATRDFHVAQGIDGAKCCVLNNGVDLTKFHPRPADFRLHHELGLPPQARFVATIGQVGMRKGIDVALAAAHSWVAALPDVHWLIIGERTSKKDEARELEVRLHAEAAAPPLAGRVHFLGTRRDVHELMPECALLLHAARQEPLGRVLLEAVACGLPVVATEVGGTREIFPTAADGAVLVPVDDATAMAREVAALLQDEPRRRELGAGARRRAEAAFDVQIAAARLIELYRSIVNL